MGPLTSIFYAHIKCSAKGTQTQTNEPRLTDMILNFQTTQHEVGDICLEHHRHYELGLSQNVTWAIQSEYIYYPIDISGTVMSERLDCLLLSGTVVSKNPDHVCWVLNRLKHISVDRLFWNPTDYIRQ